MQKNGCLPVSEAIGWFWNGQWPVLKRRGGPFSFWNEIHRREFTLPIRRGAMSDEQQNLAMHYRRLAAECLEVAERMSLRADRARMIEMAQRWLDLAKKEEAKQS